MRTVFLRIYCVILALFAFALPALADTCPDGTVVYRQSFEDVSDPICAGAVRGTSGDGGFGLSVRDGALDIEVAGDERAYVILPCYHCTDDYTVRVSFALTDVGRGNGYFGIMLTCKGDAPDNVTSVKIRANGEVDGFDSLSARLTDDLIKGQRITLTVPVKGGVVDEITVSCLDYSETLRSESIVGVVPGSIGFVLRYVSAEVYETALVKGTDYKAETGRYTSASTWTDEVPYAVKPEADHPVCADSFEYRGEAVLAPETGDNIVPMAVLAVAAFIGIVIVLRTRR